MAYSRDFSEVEILFNEKTEGKFLKKIKSLTPIKLIVSSFVLLMLLGSLLLKLPFSSADGISKSFMDCIFTSTSATCVIGLIICDTFTGWSYFGQAVILLLFQCGSIGLLTFASAFTLITRKKLGLRELQIVKEYTSGSITDIPKLIRTIMLMTFSCELVGTVLLSFAFIPRFGLLGIWISIFTAISAFCNAGFDLFGFIEPNKGMILFSNNIYVSVVIMLLVIVGGIGFLVVFDLEKQIREKITRKRNRIEISYHSRIVLITTAVLIVFGAVAFFVSEYSNTLAGHNLAEQINISFFQSVTSRTAGFTEVDFTEVHDITKFITVILMFIGASPVSTGGGIKTTTIVVIFATVISVLKGKDGTVFGKHKINQKVVNSAIAISVISLTYIFVITGIISAIESEKNISMFNILLETTSAYSTTGISASITAGLTLASKLILVLTMLIGRVGPLALFLSISGRKANPNGKILPEGKVIVG